MMIYVLSSQSFESSIAAENKSVEPLTCDSRTGSVSPIGRESLTVGVRESRIGLKANRSQDLLVSCLWGL
jgi:hypothetical protein